MGIVNNSCSNYIRSISLKGAKKSFLKTCNLCSNPFIKVSIAIIIYGGTFHAEGARFAITMADRTFFNLYFKGMGTVAFDAGIKRVYVGKVPIIGFSGIFIAAFRKSSIF